MSTPAKKLGRPSKYRKEYCEQIIDAAKRGLTFEEFASSIDMHRDTLYEWATVHVEFSDAMKRAKQEQLNFMMKIGKAAMLGQKIPIGSGQPGTVNPTLWIFWMKARHGWRDHEVLMPEDGELKFV